MRECLEHLSVDERTSGVLGILSLMFWSLTFVVGWKYLFFVMKADNRGEGGIFALLALSRASKKDTQTAIGWASLVVLVGAALLYGDGIITPAISVLSAAEGLTTFSAGFTPYVVPLSVAILAGLFLVQSKGSDAIGRLFGPVMAVWFATLAGLGIMQVLAHPEILQALDPREGLALLARHPAKIAGILGSVVLTFTGAEALYADMGHFGRRAISASWKFAVFPALVINYFGQGAYCLSHPHDPTNPFFALAQEGPLRLGLIVLSMIATVIASQALISGTFSLTQQAIQLGFCPRLKIVHTNPNQSGQIYMPFVNVCLAIGAIFLVLNFRSSSNLASAYGIAVTGTMAVTTFAFYRVTRVRWHWAFWKASLLCLSFIVFDAAFFFANLGKISDGGWLPLAIGGLMLAIMHTWKRGRSEIQSRVYSDLTDDIDLIALVRSKNVLRVSGSAVFMVATAKGTPLALLHHLKANKCLQKTVVLLTINTSEVPYVPAEAQLQLEDLGAGLWRAVGRYGYMETPDVARLIQRICDAGVPLTLASTTYYFNREMIITGGPAPMFEWQKRLYGFLSRNAQSVKDYYRLSPSQLIEIGLPIQL